MLSRDLIASIIRTFHESLEDVRDGGYENLYTAYFNKEREWFLQAQAKDITTFLADDPIYKTEMLSELLYRDARRLTDTELQGILYRKIILLYENIDARSQIFSLERSKRIQELKEQLE